MSERQIKEYYERIEKLLNGANKETYGFAPQEIKNILRSYEELQNQNKELKKQLEELELQNFNLREDIMIKKMSLPNEEIKDKTFFNLYDMPTYEDLLNQQKEFIEYMKNEIYSIEPKGTGINYNCEYDSEEDYISAMKEQSKLNTLKEILSKHKEIIGVSNDY